MKPPLSDRGERLWQAGALVYTTGALMGLFCWLLAGDFAWSMKERSITAVLQLLLKRFEASDFVAGALIGSVPAAMTMLLGPVISYRSDRYRSRWGRRIPFLVLTVPVAVVSMVGLAYGPPLGAFLHRTLGAHSPGLNAATLTLFGLFWTFFEVASVTTNALFGGLVNDVVPPAVLGRFYGVFRAFSLVAGIIFGYWLLGRAEKYYQWIFVGLAALYAVGFTLMCLKVKEGPCDPPPLPADPARTGGFLAAAREYFVECFGGSYYRWFYAAFALSTITGLPVNLFSVFLAKSLHMDMAAYGGCLALTYLISLGLAYPLGILADRFHPLRMGMAALTLYAVAVLWGWVFAKDVWAFRIVFVAHGVLGGAWLTVSASLGQRLLPRQKFAQFFSAAGIVVSLSTIVTGAVVGRALDWSHHAYQHIFLASFALTILALAANVVLHGRFMALGGPDRYAAPEPSY